MADLLLGKTEGGEPLSLDADHLCTHGVIIGMTGSGKTGLSIALIEELVLAGVPVIAIDPKGDLGNLGLVFPELRAEDLAPWVGEEAAEGSAARWRSGLEADDAMGRLSELSGRMELRVYSPGAELAEPVNVLGALGRPDAALWADTTARRDLVAGTVSALLGLVGVEADPVRSPEHLLLARIIEDAWAAGEDMDVERLILRLVDPPFKKVGVFPVDRFYPPDDRMELATRFNAVIASSSFEPWRRGRPIDFAQMCRAPDGRTPVSVFYLAHLTESERMFFVSLLMEAAVAWSRGLPGATGLRALIYLDEAFGYLPPHPRNPPSKRPLITLMKQARAAGVGVVLATQNPVDLDYKALTNAGVWALGRLSTPQDRRRVADGLKASSGEDLSGALGELKPRGFILRDVREEGPIHFSTRHALCFLRGPIARAELSQLSAIAPRSTAAAPAAAPPTVEPSVPSFGAPPGLSAAPPPPPGAAGAPDDLLAWTHRSPDAPPPDEGATATLMSFSPPPAPTAFGAPPVAPSASMAFSAPPAVSTPPPSFGAPPAEPGFGLPPAAATALGAAVVGAAAGAAIAGEGAPTAPAAPALPPPDPVASSEYVDGPVRPATRDDLLLSDPPPTPRKTTYLWMDPRAVFSARLEGAFNAFREPHRGDGALVYRPALYARVGLCFNERQTGFQLDEIHHLVCFPLDGGRPAPVKVPLLEGDLLDERPRGGRYVPLPDHLDEGPELTAAKRALEDTIYTTEARFQWVCAPLKLHGRADESLEDFRRRCVDAAEDRVDERVAALKSKYDSKVAALEEKIARGQAKVHELEATLSGQRTETAVNAGEVVLSFFIGRRRSTRSAMSTYRQSTQTEGKLKATKGEIERYEEQTWELSLELEQETGAIRAEEFASVEQIEEREVRLTRNAIELQRFGILWIPVSGRI